jgi:hypothetical protein
MIEPGKLESAIHHYLALGLIEDSFAPDIGRLNAIPTGRRTRPGCFLMADIGTGTRPQPSSVAEVHKPRAARKTNAPRGYFPCLRRNYLSCAPCRAAIDPHGFAALARTMVGHTGGAPRWSRDLATDCAGGGIDVSRRAGIGFSCHGGNGEGCCHHKRQQGRGRKIALHHHRLQFYCIRSCEMIARIIKAVAKPTGVGLAPSRRWRSQPPFKEIVRSRCFNSARCRCTMNEAVIVLTAAKGRQWPSVA